MDGLADMALHGKLPGLPDPEEEIAKLFKAAMEEMLNTIDSIQGSLSGTINCRSSEEPKVWMEETAPFTKEGLRSLEGGGVFWEVNDANLRRLRGNRSEKEIIMFRAFHTWFTEIFIYDRRN